MADFLLSAAAFVVLMVALGLVRVARGLHDEGYDVRFFTGDTSDETALEDIRIAFAGSGGGRFSYARTTSLQAVMEEVLKVDIAIVSRYSNLLCALKLERPALSLGYAEKNDELMAEFGRIPFCQQIETFDVDLLLRQVRIVLADLHAAGKAIARRNAVIRTELARQQDLLLSTVLVDRRTNK